MTIEDDFVAMLAAMDCPRVLEVGTKRWGPNATHHAAWVPEGGTMVRSDVASGEDVDVVADCHDLSPFDDGEFDAFVSCSVWEHLALPWIATQAVLRVLRPGGLCYMQTHHAFPVHGYPSDFTRWTTDGLAAMFAWAGFEVVATAYSFPARIVPPDEVRGNWDPLAPAWLNVAITARKPKEDR
jgi:SAM-dependent methyltransferase